MKKAILLVLTTILITVPVKAEPIDSQVIYGMCEMASDEVSDGHIQPEFIQAVIEKESGYTPEAVNGACTGLMQVNKNYCDERMKRLGVKNIQDPYSNILLGTDILYQYFKDCDDPYYVLMAYNMGENKAKQLYKAGKYSSYARKICQRAAELEREHGK